MLKDFPKTIRNNLQYIPFYDERSTFNLTNKGLHRGCYSVNLWNFSGHLWTNAFVSGISIKSQNTPTNLPTFSLCKIFASQSSILMSKIKLCLLHEQFFGFFFRSPEVMAKFFFRCHFHAQKIIPFSKRL